MAVTAFAGDFASWLLAMDTDNVSDGLARIDALIVESDAAFDALIHLPIDLAWVPDPALLWKARTARLYVLEIRDELQAVRRRLDG